MKQTGPTEPPLIGSGSQEEVDLRVQALLDMGTSRGYLTYDELNERLPDEVVSPDKLDSLLMMIDEMGIRLIDEADVADFTIYKTAKARDRAERQQQLQERHERTAAPATGANGRNRGAPGGDALVVPPRNGEKDSHRGDKHDKHKDHKGHAAAEKGDGEDKALEDDDGEEIDLNLVAELAEASTKRIDDPVRMYL